ncbi:MAG: hypothetical protein ACRDTV_24750 [Mycobacterium sp.]
MSNRSPYRRTADERRSRWGATTGTGMGIVVGGAVAAAFVSMGTASADDLLAPATDDGAVTDLAQAIDPNAFTAAEVPDDFVVGDAAAATDPAQATDAFEQLVQAFDGFAFTSTGAPYDWIGITASQIDANLAPTVFGPELDTIASQLLAGDFSAPTSTDVDAFALLVQTFVDPSAFDAAGDPTEWIATIGGELDALLAPTVYGPELDTIADQIIAAFTAAVS